MQVVIHLTLFTSLQVNSVQVNYILLVADVSCFSWNGVSPKIYMSPPWKTGEFLCYQI
jgi:hypothetical protein